MAECQIVDLARAFLCIIQPKAHKDRTNVCVISIFIVEHLTDPQVLNLSLCDVPKYLDITESKTDQNVNKKSASTPRCSRLDLFSDPSRCFRYNRPDLSVILDKQITRISGKIKIFCPMGYRLLNFLGFADRTSQ